MSYLLRMALRNTLRNRRRSALTGVAIIVGVAIFVLAQSLIAGIERTMIGTEVDSEHAHLRVMSRGFASDEDFFPTDQALPDVAGLRERLRERFPSARTAQRTAFSAQLTAGGRSLNCRGLAMDPHEYASLLRLGELPGASGHHAWLGSDVAAAFGFKPGDRLSLQAKTRHGTRNALTDVVIAGFITTGHPLVDNFTIFVPSTSGQELLDTDADYATELLVRFADPDAAMGAKRLVETANVTAQTWQEKTEYIIRFNNVRRAVFSVVTAVIMLIAAAGVANTTLMSGFERIAEIGALLALGLSRQRVMALFLIEACLIAVLGVGTGLALGSVPSWYLERHGLPFPKMDEGGAAVPIPPVLYFDLTANTLVLAALIGLAVTITAALYPAWKLSRTDPIYALKVEG